MGPARQMEGRQGAEEREGREGWRGVRESGIKGEAEGTRGGAGIGGLARVPGDAWSRSSGGLLRPSAAGDPVGVACLDMDLGGQGRRRRFVRAKITTSVTARHRMTIAGLLRAFLCVAMLVMCIRFVLLMYVGLYDRADLHVACFGLARFTWKTCKMLLKTSSIRK